MRGFVKKHVYLLGRGSLSSDTHSKTCSCRSARFLQLKRVSMGWWFLRLSAKILALLRLSVNFFQLRLTKKLKINFFCLKELNIAKAVFFIFKAK